MILVDTLRLYPKKPHGHRWWCHMVSDTSLEELHAFAAGIGLDPSWFQDKILPHYDLTAGTRTKAVRAGAVAVSQKELVQRGVKAPRMRREGETA